LRDVKRSGIDGKFVPEPCPPSLDYLHEDGVGFLAEDADNGDALDDGDLEDPKEKKDGEEFVLPGVEGPLAGPDPGRFAKERSNVKDGPQVSG